jgi:hypothetical protein
VFAYHRGASVFFTAVLLISEPFGAAQQAVRTRVAEGEYKVTIEGDLGCGPIETEIFHFAESWTLWRTAAGYDLEGHRTYESPRDKIHDDRFVAKLAPDLRLVSTKEFARLVFRRDSGPLTCEFLPQQLRCDSGAKDPANGVDVEYAMDHPYSLIWPLSAFSLAGLTRVAPSQVNKPVPIQVVQLEEISDVLPILAIRSDGLIRYLGQAQNSFEVSGQSWHPNVYELTASPVRKMTIWTTPEGLLLLAERPNWPKGRMELVKFTKFADF